MPASPPAAAEASGRPATDPAGPTGRLATWVAETTLDDVPAPVRDRAKYLVLDGIGCAVVGAQLPVSRIGVAGVTALDSGGDARNVGFGGDGADEQVAGDLAVEQAARRSRPRLRTGRGRAPAGDDLAVRWVAVRHAEDHIHLVAMLARSAREIWPRARTGYW